MGNFHPKLVIISAPSGAGKTTLVKEIMHHFDFFEFSISATTRAPRNQEVEGVHYYFISESEFRTRISRHEFVEWEEVYPGRLYGTLRSEVDRIQQKGKCPIFDVDVVGGIHLKEQFGSKAVSIFIAPPTPDTLAQRLKKRATDSQEDIEKRLAKSHHELSYQNRFDYIVVNDLLDQAIAELAEIIEQELGV